MLEAKLSKHLHVSKDDLIFVCITKEAPELTHSSRFFDINHCSLKSFLNFIADYLELTLQYFFTDFFVCLFGAPFHKKNALNSACTALLNASFFFAII